MVNCSCFHDVLLLNFDKRHSNRTVNRCHIRIGKLVEANAIEFSENAIRLLKGSAKAITSGETVFHNCDQTPAIVKLIKKKLAKNVLMIAESGTTSSRALVPYYPQDNVMMEYEDPDVNRVSTSGINSTESGTQTRSQTTEMEVDNEDQDDIEVLMIKENKKPRKCRVKNMGSKERKDKHQPRQGCSFWPEEELRSAQEDGGPARKKPKHSDCRTSTDFQFWLNKWVQENRNEVVPNADDLVAITDHYYKHGNPRFFCEWRNGRHPTWEPVSVITEIAKISNEALSIYLKNMRNGAFKNLIEKAPILIYAVSAVNRRVEARDMGPEENMEDNIDQGCVKKEERQ